MAFAKVSDISEAAKSGQSLTTTNNYITTETAKKLRAKVFPPGTTLFAKIGEAIRLNRRVITAINCCADNNVMAVTPNEEISEKFIFYFLRTISFVDASRATTVPSIRKSDVEDIEICLPPLNEQRRIAEKLDTTLAAVEACKQKLNNAAETIQRFRQSVLAAAVSGELTREWREERGASKDSWQNLRLRDIGEFGRGKSKHRPRNDPRLFGGAYPFIQTGEVAKSEELITEHKQTLSEFGLKQSKLWPSGTLCITIAANIADTAILSYPACFPDSVVGFMADQQKAKTRYIKWLIESIASDLERFAPATAQKNINLSILDEIVLAIPSLDEQQAAVTQGQELLDYANEIDSKICKALEQTTLMEKSLLAKAFRGELVPQDPKDEPASVLLQRIKAQREAEAAANKPAKRGRKKKADAAQLVIPEGIAGNHLAKVLKECGALSERALLAASELEPAVFQLQLTKEIDAGGLKHVDVDGEAAYVDAAWEEEG